MSRYKATDNDEESRRARSNGEHSATPVNGDDRHYGDRERHYQDRDRHYKDRQRLREIEPEPIPSDLVPREDLASSAAGLESQPLLDPDDPQVSPLNLEKIKILKFTQLVLVIINLLLFIVLLSSEFFAIPGFNNRGKSFLEMDLALICLFFNSVNNIFFVVPSYYERVMGYIVSGFLLFDLVLVLIVEETRQLMGLLGCLLILWTCLNSTFNSLIDYWVEKGRHYQEIRLTGRIEKRKSITELGIIMVKVLFEVFILWTIWCISLTLWLSCFDKHEKPWGKLVPVDNNQFRVHLACFGDVHKKSEQPIILVEGGQTTSSEVFQEWIEELFQLGKIERYCIWDRPGYGWSDSAPPPDSIGIITEYLSEALQTEKIEGPFTVVGFDIGGLYARMFSSRHRAQIHSILFVDSWSPDLLKKWPFSGSGKKNESTKVFKNSLEVMDNITGFKLWMKGFISPLGIIPNLHWFLHPMRYSSKSRIFGRDMYYSSRYIRARCQEQLISSILSYNEIREADINEIPVGVISSDFMIKKSLNWGKWQREISKLSSKTAEWVIAENSDHFIWRSPKGRKQLQDLLLRLIGEQEY
ncbi:hypothetical protein KGF56_000063 [Candida oxycetoniae]|uniref:AB hydrolase-1 domain-containing protein n=1 Tax=Candida oxycetoniae TaxID=497107 RepID=A0AAI9X044_9ASCO|nr:uncharacterized protein KGF56_000063 [Candida oxycetoniae]KAI3407076.2 hypothetical protein KGF56_000063 [Candida oxycetoniae]